MVSAASGEPRIELWSASGAETTGWRSEVRRSRNGRATQRPGVGAAQQHRGQGESERDSNTEARRSRNGTATQRPGVGTAQQHRGQKSERHSNTEAKSRKGTSTQRSGGVKTVQQHRGQELERRSNTKARRSRNWCHTEVRTVGIGQK